MNCFVRSFGVPAVKGEEKYVDRILDMPVELNEYMQIKDAVKYVGVTDRFKDVIATFDVPEGETPAGFERTMSFEKDGVVRVDLERNISYDKNGELRPQNVLFSADTANVYEVAPISNLISNLTCNPGIIYDLFINNPDANIGHKFNTRDEVMTELARILPPGVDVSVELNDPFEPDFDKILEECAKFRDIFSKYRIVIKVPHTGPVNRDNVGQLLQGKKQLDTRFTDVATEDALRGHNLALKLHEAGYRVNFTLMFEPYQTRFALQARPYFINTFLRHRLKQSTAINNYLALYDVAKDDKYLEELRGYLIDNDYYAPSDNDISLLSVEKFSRDLIKYRHFNDEQGSDGLDGMRHNLRLLKNCNMKDTRLIVCSMEGEENYPDIDKLLTEPEFEEMNKKVVVTAEPNYIARFTSTNQVISYQRRFMNAANGEK